MLFSSFLGSLSKEKFLSPTRFIGISWGLMYFLSALQIIVFPRVSSSAWLYLAFFVTVQLLGVFLGGLGKNIKHQNEKARVIGLFKYLASSKMVTLISVLGLVGVFSSLYDSIVLNSLDPSRLDLTRDVLNILYSHQSSWINRIATFSQPFSWLSIILIALYTEYLNPKIKTAGVLIFIGLVCLGIASAGRTIIIKCFLILFLVILARKSLGFQPWPWKWNLLTRSILAVISIGLFSYFLNIWAWRVGGSEYLSVDINNFFYQAEESEGLKFFLKVLVPDKLKTTTLLLTFYIFTFADNFALFFDKVYIQPYWGLWQFFSLASAFSRLGLTDQTSDGIYLSMLSAYRAVGLWPAQWRTMAQEYIIDFGREGALIASFFSGLVIGWIYKKLRKGNYQWLALFIVLLFCAIHGAYSSTLNPIQLLLFVYSLIYGWIARKAIKI